MEQGREENSGKQRQEINSMRQGALDENVKGDNVKHSGSFRAVINQSLVNHRF